MLVIVVGKLKSYLNSYGKEYRCSNKHSIFESKIEKYLLDNIQQKAKEFISRSVNIISKGQEEFKDNSKENSRYIIKLR